MKKLFITSFILIVLLNASIAIFAMRLPPKPVDKIVHKGIEYRAPHTTLMVCSLMGCVEAYDLKTGIRLWWKQIYVVRYDPNLETDVQDIFIKKMMIKGNDLLIEDERGRKYSLNLSSLEVKRIEKEKSNPS